MPMADRSRFQEPFAWGIVGGPEGSPVVTGRNYAEAHCSMLAMLNVQRLPPGCKIAPLAPPRMASMPTPAAGHG